MATQKSKIYYGWWVLLACVVGLSVGPAQFAFGSLGLFMQLLTDEFGWSRGEISISLTVFTVSLVFAMPIAGKYVDRYGSKVIVLPSLLILGLSLAAIPVFTSELWHLYLIFFIIGTLAAATNSLPYMLTISAWFDRRRGFAIGLAMAGSGAGYAYVPPLVEAANSRYGWHAGYYVLAAIVLLFAIPLIAALYRNKPADLGLLPDGRDKDNLDESKNDLSEAGLNRQQAIRKPYFWQLAIIFTLLSFSLFGLLPHIFPMLVDRGMSSEEARSAAGLVGVSIMCFRIIIGFLLDHIFAPYVATFAFLMSAIGIGLLAMGADGPYIYLSAILIGLSIGAEMDLLAFITGRYFGLKHFGKIYGLLFASMMLGVSLGPVTFGYCYDLLGDYILILSVSCGLITVTSIITAFLPPFPDFEGNNTSN